MSAPVCRHCRKAGLRLLAPGNTPTETIRDDPSWRKHRVLLVKKLDEGIPPEEAWDIVDKEVKLPSPWDMRWCPRCRHYCWPISKTATTPRQKAPRGSTLSSYFCGCAMNGVYVHFIVTEGKDMKTEVCPNCGQSNIYRKVGGEWIRED